MTRLLAVLLALLATLLPAPARAWDPSTTHIGMLERAALEGEMHTRWMENSARTRGLFTPLRIDPARLDPEVRRRLLLALRRAHADAGAVPLGGPGACPPLGSPPSTRARCVDGDLWEATALGWMRLGVVLEVSPPARLLHHFVDGLEPARARWRARDATRLLTRAWLRRVERRAGGSVAAYVGRSGFDGTATSAIGWLDDPRDPFAPPSTRAHLRAASLAATPAERDHHLALAMIGTGALLHVVQDLTVPAHARGDLAAMFLPLSAFPTDRGSPLGEYARMTFGRRSLPRPVELAPRKAGEGTTMPADLETLLLGTGKRDGLVDLAARRFLSEGTLFEPKVVEDDVEPEVAAGQLLATLSVQLDPAELVGARMAPWPAEAGYVLNGAGRPLAAWERGPDGIVRPYVDVHVLRSQALVLLPAAVEATKTALELAWPSWPDDAHDAGANTYQMDAPLGLANAELYVLVEDADGRRAMRRRIQLRADGRSLVRDIVPAGTKKDARVVLVLEGQRKDGSAVIVERRLDGERAPRVVTPPPGAPPARGTTPPPAPDAPATEPPLPVDPAPVEPPPAETPGRTDGDGDVMPGNRAAPPGPGTPSIPPPESPSTNQPMPTTPPDPPNEPKR